MLQAYFDESERDGGVFCVAGYAFAPPQAKKFAKQWRLLFGERCAHMVDLVARRGQFKDITPAERDRLIREAVKIINQRMTVGVAISCNVEEVRSLSPRWIRGFGHAYPICCHLSMIALSDWLDKFDSSERVTYVFEAGHPSEAEARDFIRGALENPDVKRGYRHEGDAFLPKTDAVPLQGADMLAWEWAKFRDETLEQGIRPLRQSLRALFEYDPKRYSGAHVTGAPLAKFMKQIRGMGLLELQEQREAKDATKRRDVGEA